MKKHILISDKVDLRYKRPHIKGANIPVDLIIGLGVKEIKKMYPWLEDNQIEDALDFVKECIDKQGSALYKKYSASPITQIQTA